ncbi:DinB family protein [Variovorax gossypii]
MTTQTLLNSLFRYKSWADEGLLAGLATLAERAPQAEYQAAVRVFNHACIVDRIFVANLQRMEHGCTATGSDTAPPLRELAETVRETDRWYVAYTARVSTEELAQIIDFTFTDGAAGRMSRQEMLGHVVTHAGYHRGEVGRIMWRLMGSSPPDTFTGFLHQAEPARRMRA